jgi:hypothetical protein
VAVPDAAKRKHPRIVIRWTKTVEALEQGAWTRIAGSIQVLIRSRIEIAAFL